MHRCTMLSCSRWIVSSSLVSTKHDVWHCSNLHWAQVLCRRSRVSRHETSKHFSFMPTVFSNYQFDQGRLAISSSSSSFMIFYVYLSLCDIYYRQVFFDIIYVHWLGYVLLFHKLVDWESWDDNPGDLFWIGWSASNSQLVMWASAHYSRSCWNSNIFTDFIDVGGQLVQASCVEYVPFVSFCATGEDMYFRRFLQLSWWAAWEMEKVAAPELPCSDFCVYSSILLRRQIGLVPLNRHILM